MPNWVYTTMKVIGNRKKLDKFKKFIAGKNKYDNKKKVLDEDKLMPYPKEFRELDLKAGKYQDLKEKKKLNQEEKKFLMLCELENFDGRDGFNSGGYDWCLQNWGTKWGFCSTEIVKKTKSSIWYYYETAWNFPLPLMIKMSNMFPDLRFNCKTHEEGGAFKGIIIFKGGKVIKEDLK